MCCIAYHHYHHQSVLIVRVPFTLFTNASIDVAFRR